MSVINRTEHTGCPDCAYYKDCPIDYSCPFKEIFEGFMDEPTRTAIIKVNGYTFLRSKRNDYDLDDDDTEE